MSLSILFKTIFYLSFMGSIVTGIIILIKQLFKNKLSAKWHYYIWLFLILRLIIPYEPQTNFSIFNLFSNISKSLQISSTKIAKENVVFNSSKDENGNSINKAVNNKSQAAEKGIKQNSTENSAGTEKGINKETPINGWIENNKSFSINYLSIIWAVGILIIILYILAVNIRLHSITNKLNKYENDQINKLLEECKTKININSNVAIIINKHNKAPHLLGIFKPKIIISSQIIDKFSLEEIRYIFLHELFHLKKKDILINWIIILVQAVHWFNPVIWYALHKMKQDCEISCDEMVLNCINTKEAINYGQTILNLAKAFSNNNLTPGVTAIVNKSEARRRIIMISNFNKKSKKWTAAAIMLTLVVGGVSLIVPNESVKAYLGLNNQKENTMLNGDTGGKTEVLNSDKQKSILDNFNSLINKNANTAEVSKFVEDNISKVSKENASILLYKLEEYQKKNLTKLEEQFTSGVDIQISMNKVYKSGFDINKIDYIQDKKLKDLLIEMRKSGYKIETAEGMYFPVLNYEIYKNYSSYVTEDLKDYIEIMAVESNKVPVKDGAIMITCDELLQRALNQEQFINKYKNSVKINDIKELYKRYTAFVLYGTDNTPLFSYDTKVLSSEAKNSYIKAIKANNNSKLLSNIKGLLSVLEENNYKLTDEVERYRKSILQ